MLNIDKAYSLENRSSMTEPERKSLLTEIILENYAKRATVACDKRKKEVLIETYAFLSTTDKDLRFLWRDRFDYLRGYYTKNIKQCIPINYNNYYIDEFRRVK